MAIDLAFRRRALRTLTNEIECYVLCDRDQAPIYVGQSVDGTRARVNRHLTSARSDIIADRQVDVWETAWVWTYPVENKADITAIENCRHYFLLARQSVPDQPGNDGDSVCQDALQGALVRTAATISESGPAVQGHATL